MIISYLPTFLNQKLGHFHHSGRASVFEQRWWHVPGFPSNPADLLDAERPGDEEGRSRLIAQCSGVRTRTPDFALSSHR